MFLCERCGFNTNRKDNLKRHLKRKKVCKPTKLNITRDELIKKMEPQTKRFNIVMEPDNNNLYICSKCNTSYKHRSSFQRHINTGNCYQSSVVVPEVKEIKSSSNILDSNFYDEYLNLKFEQLKKQQSPDDDGELSTRIGLLEKTMAGNGVPTLAELMNDKPQNNQLNHYQPQTNNQSQTYNNLSNITNVKGVNTVGDNNQIDNRYQNSNIDNRYQNNQHITNNIYINEFGNENIDHITKKDWKNIIHKYYGAIPTLVEKVHIENQENQNIFIPSIKDNYALIYEKNNWQFRALTQVLEEIISANADRLYDFINDNQGEIDERTILKLDTIMEQLENGDTLYKKYQNEIKYLLLNNRNLIKAHYEKNFLKPIKHR